MAGYRSLLRVIKVKHKVITPDKGEMKEAAAAAEAFYATSQRLTAYGMALTTDTAHALSGADVAVLVTGATKGVRTVSVPRLTQTLERAATLRGQYASKRDIIDPQTKLTAGDLDTMTAAAAQTLGRARAVAANNRRQQTLSSIWLVLAFLAMIGLAVLILNG